MPTYGSRAATCTSSVGPGIAPPARMPSGMAGFHASWYGQSGYMSLCMGTKATATVAFYNSGSRGWVAGRMGETAYLGTWTPEPGQDSASIRWRWNDGLSGDGMAALQPIGDAARAVRRAKSDRVVPIPDRRAAGAGHVSRRPSSAHRRRAVDGGLRRVLGGHRAER